MDKLTAKGCDDEAADSQLVKRFGRGGVDRPGKDSWCPLHLAVSGGHIQAAKVRGVNDDLNEERV